MRPMENTTSAIMLLRFKEMQQYPLIGGQTVSGSKWRTHKDFS